MKNFFVGIFFLQNILEEIFFFLENVLVEKICSKSFVEKFIGWRLFLVKTIFSRRNFLCSWLKCFFECVSLTFFGRKNYRKFFSLKFFCPEFKVYFCWDCFLILCSINFSGQNIFFRKCFGRKKLFSKILLEFFWSIFLSKFYFAEKCFGRSLFLEKKFGPNFCGRKFIFVKTFFLNSIDR